MLSELSYKRHESILIVALMTARTHVVGSAQTLSAPCYLLLRNVSVLALPREVRFEHLIMDVHHDQVEGLLCAWQVHV